MGVSKNRGTPKWMVYNGKTLLKWMIWGYHHFRKPPYEINKIWVKNHVFNGWLDLHGFISSLVILMIPFGFFWLQARQTHRDWTPRFRVSWSPLLNHLNLGVFSCFPRPFFQASTSLAIVFFRTNLKPEKNLKEKKSRDDKTKQNSKKGEDPKIPNSKVFPSFVLMRSKTYKTSLGGGFKHFLCSPLFGEDSHFD